MPWAKVKGGEFAFAVGQMLREYSDDVAKACAVCAEETASDIVDELKTVSSGHTGRTWKKFPRAWTYTMKQMSWGEVRGTVHLKKPMYRIGHLLEFGHAVAGGGRIAPDKKTSVQGDHFIEPIAVKYEEIYTKKMEDIIGAVV